MHLSVGDFSYLGSEKERDWGEALMRDDDDDVILLTGK